MVDEAEIKANVEAVKQRQEAREEAERTKQFVQEMEEMRKRNEAKIRAEKEYQEKLQSEKSSAQRIRLRQQEEERIRLENLRISAANKGIKQQENTLRPINTETLKGTVREAVSRSPGILDRAVTGIFTPIVQQATGERKQPDFVKGFKQESKEFSRAVSSTAKKPVTGGKVKPIRNQFTISADERFAKSLLGGISTPQQLRQPVKVGKQQVQQQPEKMDPTRPLNNLLRRII